MSYSYIGNQSDSQTKRIKNDANTAHLTANSASSYANGAFGVANTADQRAVTSGSYANSSFPDNPAASSAVSIVAWPAGEPVKSCIHP